MTAAVPFRVGVMQLTMEPLEEMLDSARAMDEAGMDTIWLAEAYPWWRKHGMEAKSSTVLAGMIALETRRLAVGWGIISPYTRHPGAGGDGCPPRAGGRGPGPLHRGLRHLQDLPEQHQAGRLGAADEAARAHARLGRDHARHPRRRALRVRRRGLLGRHPGAAGRGARAALGGARVRRGHRAAHAAARRRDRRRPADPVDHDAEVRGVHLRQRPHRRRARRARPGVGRRRLHDRRLDPRHRPRQGPRRRARDRRHVPREQGAEHPGLGRHAARARRHRPRGDPPGRRGDGAGRAPRREGQGHRLDPRPLQADRRERPTTASRRSRSTARPAARTSCSSCGARTGTSRSGSSASRSSRAYAPPQSYGDRSTRIGSSSSRAAPSARRASRATSRRWPS